MADSTSDSGSVQSFQCEPVTEKKAETFRFYALYSLSPHRLQSVNEGFQSAALEDEDGTLSMSIIATNLTAAAETDLRKTLVQKLGRTNKQLQEGDFITIKLSHAATEALSPASCYYCQIDTCPERLDFDPVTPEGEVDESVASSGQQFVVCYITFVDSSLYHFRPELQQYTDGLIPLLDKELNSPTSPQHSSNETLDSVPTTDSSLHQKQLSQLSRGIPNYLEQWPFHVLDYLTRTLQLLGASTKHLIYSALLNATLQMSGVTSQQEQDIKRVYNCCSLSSLLEQLQQQSQPLSDSTSSTNDCDLWQLQPLVVTLTLTPDQEPTFEKSYSCMFCDNAVHLLLKDPENANRIKELLESVKLGFVHSLNTLKRFLKQAEIDHYALHRAFSYLKVRGCGDLLLRYVKLDGGPETLKVLAVLEAFIRDSSAALL